MHVLHGAAESLALGCDAVGALQCASRKEVGPQYLHNAIMKFLRKHNSVYGDTIVVFKHHQAAHLAEMYDLFQVPC